MENIMKQKNKAIIVAVLACMVVATVFIVTRILDISFAYTGTVSVGNSKYLVCDKVLLHGNTAVYLMPKKSSVTSVNIPDTIKVKGKEYNVVQISDAALSYCPKLKKLTIGKNISYIGASAFLGCKSLKSITIKTPGISKKSIKRDAFAGLNKKVVVTVPESKLDEYSKLFKSRGLNGKSQKVIGMRMECDDIPEQAFGPDNPLKDPIWMSFYSGGYFHTNTGEYTPEYWDEEDIKKAYKEETDTMKYAAGDTIHFSTQFNLDPEIEGMYQKRPKYGWVYMCNLCHMRFDSDVNYGRHMLRTNCIGNFPGYTWSNDGTRSYVEDCWIPDDSPCSIKLHIAIPDGLVYQKGSFNLRHCNKLKERRYKVDDNAYRAEITGNEIIVTIDNIKSEPLSMGEINPPFEILFNAEVSSTASATETVTASLSYGYKGAEKTVDYPDVTVHTAKMELTCTDVDGNALDGEFTLYRGKVKYNHYARGIMEFHKYAEGTTGDMPLVFNGLAKGKYKLEYKTGSEECVVNNTVIFTIDAETDSTGIQKLTVEDTSENPLFSCTTDPETGTIKAAFVGIAE